MYNAKRLWRATLLLLSVIAIMFALSWFTRPPRKDYWTQLFQGITYRRQARSAPRPLMIHTIEIDLTTPTINFLVTPGDENSNLDLPARTTSAFLQEFGLQLAINGSFFEPFRARSPWNYYPRSGDSVKVRGLAISDRQKYSDDEPNWPVLCISSDGRAQILQYGGCSADAIQALAGNHMLVEYGVSVAPPNSRVHPRTAVAVDAQGQRLWLIVVDGRQRYYSEGVTLGELAEIVLELGADIALNLDGGGSSTLVVADSWGPHTLNAPIHTYVPMRQRPVGNHLGIYALPVK